VACAVCVGGCHVVCAQSRRVTSGSSNTGRDALARGFGYYRGDRTNAAAVMPTVALGRDTAGDRLFQQHALIADQLTGDVIEDSGHLIPLDRPDAVDEHLLVDVPYR
jgi:hypothetical protein